MKLNRTVPAALQRTFGGLYRTVCRVTDIYRDCHLPRSAAALAYYLLLALFPTAVSISILMYRHHAVPHLVWEALVWMERTLEDIGGFSWDNPGGISAAAVFAASLTLLLSASAGAFRCLLVTASEISQTCTVVSRHRAPSQDKGSGTPHRRLSGILGSVIAYLFAVVLFAAVYAAIFLLLLWEELIALLTDLLPDNGGFPADALTEILSASRGLVLLVLFFGLCCGLLRLLPPHTPGTRVSGAHRTPTVPGALFCTVGLCASTVWFALFIRGSAGYSLVYGSLASLILFLTWIFVCGNVIFLGIALNAALLSARR